MTVHEQFLTHKVINQPAPSLPWNPWQADALVQKLVVLYGADWSTRHLMTFGHRVGFELMSQGDLANRFRPILHTFDRHGRRIDHVEFHPAYHALMGAAMEAEVHSYSWSNAQKSGAHVARAALLYLYSQADAGSSCPLTMTHAVIPALSHAGDAGMALSKQIITGRYDARHLPPSKKAGLTIGMGMTEKQGGSDVRRNTTRAIHQADGSYRLIGHKFFFSAPMCDAHLVLAQADGGLSCFFLPRVLDDGSNNHVRIQRLKDKLGDWSNASAEVEFQGAEAWLMGQEGRGVPVIIDMVALTRLDCMIGSSSLMRLALTHVMQHVEQREAFGRRLLDQPLMRNVIADLALEHQASLQLSLRVAHAIGRADEDPAEAAFARVATAIGKYWICKRTPAFINEAQECMGGLGYVEENPLPRLVRQAPLNSIWEGSGNVQCLDVLRALHKEPETLKAVFAELKASLGKHPAYDRHVESLMTAFADREHLELRSRTLVEKAALGLQASLMLRHGDPQIAETFCRARLDNQQGLAFGTLSADACIDTLISSLS